MDGGVVGVLVTDEERSLDLAAVGVDVLVFEDLLVDVDVVDVDGAVEGEGDHLGHLGHFEVAGDLGAVGGAEAVGEDALTRVALLRRVGVFVDAARRLVGAVSAIA